MNPFQRELVASRLNEANTWIKEQIEKEKGLLSDICGKSML